MQCPDACTYTHAQAAASYGQRGQIAEAKRLYLKAIQQADEEEDHDHEDKDNDNINNNNNNNNKNNNNNNNALFKAETYAWH